MADEEQEAINQTLIAIETCRQSARNESILGSNWCESVWDDIMCWPASPPNTKVFLPCPPIKGLDQTQMAYRLCDLDGQWEGRVNSNFSDSLGWTNYSMCFVAEIKQLMDKLHASSSEDAEMKVQVAVIGRALETAGLLISLTTIIVSLIIFSSFRSLSNNRTRIHWHLFVAMKIQLLIRLTLYIDQYVTRSMTKAMTKPRGIDNTPILCESFYVLLEYAKTAMFLWMFIEGLYLHNVVTVAVFNDKPNYKFYYILGWGLPVPLTAVWVLATSLLYTDTECWWGYNLSPYYWILEAPRLTVVMVNLMFLLNIMKVLVTKLQASVSSELQQVKKAVKAAIVLLPLLGITNSLQMVHSPVESSIAYFAFWTYFSTLLTALQGFFVAFIYCFLNNEVRTTIRRHWKHFLLTRGFARKKDRMSSVCSSSFHFSQPSRQCGRSSDGFAGNNMSMTSGLSTSSGIDTRHHLQEIHCNDYTFLGPPLISTMSSNDKNNYSWV